MDDLCSTFIFLGLYVSVCMHYTEAQSACPTQPCPPGTFCFRGTSTMCLQCNPKCVECSGPGTDECIKCETGFRLDKGSCIYSSTLPSVPAALPGQGCPSYDCPEDSYCFRGTIVVCVPCHMRCSGCTGPGADECKSCQSGYKKTAGLCTNSSIPTPVTYPPGIGCPDSPCSPLMFCFRGTKIICLECNPACYGCTGPGPDECRQCNSGYAWNSGLCIFTGQTNQVPTTGLPNNSLPGSTNTTILVTDFLIGKDSIHVTSPTHVSSIPTQSALISQVGSAATGQTNQVSTTGLLNNSLPDSTTTTTLATTLPVLVTTPRAFDIFNDLSSQIHESFILVNWTINPNLVQFSWNASISYQRIGIGDCLNVSENLFGPIGIDQMNTSFRIGNPEPWSRYRITLAAFGNGNITGLNSTRSIEVTSAEIVPRGLIDNFQVVTTSSTSATFNWTEVLCEYRGGQLLWYEIDVTAVNTTAVLQGLLTNVTYISVNGLAPSTHYMVSVRYVNTAGTGNSSVHYFQTSENATATTPHDSTIIQIETTLPTHDTTANAIGLFENFTYTNTNNSLLVTWSFNPSFFHISWNVTLTYQRIGIGDCQSVNESVFGPYAVGQNTSFSLGSPEPWSKYRFTLVALANGNVSSMNSTKSIEAISAEIVPTGLIADLHVITKSSESATFNWTEVPCGRRGGTLLRYEVNVTSVNTTGGSQMLQTNNTYITVNGLAPSTFYAVSVRYVNNAGASNSSVLNFQTDENVTTTVSPVPTPLAPGTEVFDTLTTANNNNALQITWNIAPGPRIYSWNITISYQRIGIGDCERVNENQLGPFLIGQGETSYSLDHPEVWSRYRFTLSARGIGVVSYITSTSSVEATSAEAAPVGVVSNFTTIRVNTTSVTLGWINVPCRQRGGQLTNFEVILKILNTTSVLKRLNSNVNSITISGLNATTYYTVSVRYINLAGAGNFSPDYVFRTLDNVTTTTTQPPQTSSSTVLIVNMTTELPQTQRTILPGQKLFQVSTPVNINGTIQVKWSINASFEHDPWNISIMYQRVGIGDCDNATDNPVGPIYVRQNETSYSLTNVEPWSRYTITLTGSGNANLSNVITSESIEMVSSEVVPNGIIKDLHILNTTSTSAMIGWTDLPCNQRGGVLLGYDIKVAPVNTTGDTQSLLTNATYVAVTALKPATFYTASVRYVNSAGPGNFSEYFLFQTMENVTSRTTFAAVTEIVFTNLTTTVQVSTPLTSGQNLFLNLTAVNSSGTIEVKWSLDVRFAHFSWNISLVYQKIGIGDCDNATDNSVDPIYVRQDETSYSLTNVEPWSRYTITLTGSGNANLSNVITSESIEMVSSEVVPNGIIKDLHIINTTSTSAMIGWTDLPCNQRGGVLLGYDVKVAPVNTTGDTQSLLTNATYVAVTALKPATFYTASVRYVNSAGPGNFSEYFLFQTMENVTSRTTFEAVTESVFTILTTTVQVSTPLTSGQVLFQTLTAVNSNGTIEITWSLDVTLAHFSWNISVIYQKIGIGDCDNATENSFGLIHIMQNVTSYSFIPEPWSRYKITLSGIGNANISNVVTSDSIEAVSREVVPNGIIKDLHIINTTSTSAMIGWTDLPCNQRGGVLLGYDVEVAPVNTTGDTQSLLTNETYVDVTALNPATFYTVSVRYVNSAGSGNFSDYFVFQTLENGSSSTTLTALTQTLQTNLTTTTQEPTSLIQETDIWEYMNAVPQNNSLEVTWSLSQNYRHYSWNITLIYQRIGIGDCQNVAERQIGPLALPQNSSSHSINNTMAWSKYRITLIAQRSDVISEFNSTKSTEVITSESAPEGVVSNVSIINVSSTSVTFGWTDLPCEWRGGSLLFYNVFVRPTSDISALLNLTTNSTFITVSGLTPFTSYAASVRYVNGAGAGNFSDEVIFTTSEDVPGPVDINELEPDATSIIVHINLSSPPNGKIVMYNVSYSDTENFTTELLLVYNATSSEPLVIGNLSSNMTYYVKVLACTSAGCGRYGNVSSVRTMEALVFGNVSSRETLKALPLESSYVTKNMSGISCIGLTWAAFSQSSPASSGYNVTVRNQNDNQTVGSSVALEPNATEYVRCGLNPGDNYSLSLISYTRSLSGDVIDTVVYADQGGSQAPPAPILVNLTTTTATIRLVPIKHRTESTVVWQIKVHDVGSDGGDNGTSNIAETFSVTNIPGHVTAELYPMTATGIDVFTIGDGQEYGGYKNTPLLPGHRYAVFFIVMSVDRNNLTSFSYARMTNSITTPTSEPPSSKRSTTISTAIVHPSVNNKVDIEVLPNTATDMSWNHIPEPEPLSTSPTLIGIIVGVILLVVIVVVIVIVKLYWRFRRNRMPKSGIDQYSKHKFETLRKGDATSLANHSGRSTINDQMYTLME